MTVPEGHAKAKSVASPAGTRLPKSKFGANNNYLMPAKHRADLWAGHPDQLDRDANPLFRGCFLLATDQEIG